MKKKLAKVLTNILGLAATSTIWAFLLVDIIITKF